VLAVMAVVVVMVIFVAYLPNARALGVVSPSLRGICVYTQPVMAKAVNRLGMRIGPERPRSSGHCETSNCVQQAFTWR
jgi:hypothetical protein